MTEGVSIFSGEIRQVLHAIGKAPILCNTMQGEDKRPHLRRLQERLRAP